MQIKLETATLEQDGKGVRSHHMENSVAVRCTRDDDGMQCLLTLRTVCVTVRCTRDDEA